ncbi:hypothetical protein KIN20_035400 [Parelaphostrongylus tenuis]|uniref:Uncharacterized protein n=1 Tax=Parelaphostrongylus tenuis TaxID=148309 RepID=A0AAD5WJN5_PARTN|nr:hypothetical protein KIN20_035400 [Parelaphostrongylus tenuis]
MGGEGEAYLRIKAKERGTEEVKLREALEREDGRDQGEKIKKDVRRSWALTVM